MKRRRVTIHLAEELLELADQLAAQRGVSRSAVISMLIAEAAFRRHDGGIPPPGALPPSRRHSGGTMEAERRQSAAETVASSRKVQEMKMRSNHQGLRRRPPAYADPPKENWTGFGAELLAIYPERVDQAGRLDIPSEEQLDLVLMQLHREGRKRGRILAQVHAYRDWSAGKEPWYIKRLDRWLSSGAWTGSFERRAPKPQTLTNVASARPYSEIAAEERAAAARSDAEDTGPDVDLADWGRQRWGRDGSSPAPVNGTIDQLRRDHGQGE